MVQKSDLWESRFWRAPEEHCIPKFNTSQNGPRIVEHSSHLPPQMTGQLGQMAKSLEIDVECQPKAYVYICLGSVSAVSKPTSRPKSLLRSPFSLWYGGSHSFHNFMVQYYYLMLHDWHSSTHRIWSIPEVQPQTITDSYLCQLRE